MNLDIGVKSGFLFSIIFTAIKDIKSKDKVRPITRHKGIERGGRVEV